MFFGRNIASQPGNYTVIAKFGNREPIGHFKPVMSATNHSNFSHISCSTDYYNTGTVNSKTTLKLAEAGVFCFLIV